jgi:lysyl-tRNA synthetase class 1
VKEIDLNPKDCFRSLYRILLGKDYGPKIGTFLAIQGKERIFDVINYLL